MKVDERRLADYARWHRLMVSTRDIDPHYDVLRVLDRSLGPETGAWLILRMVAYYHLGSALRSLSMSPGPGMPRAALGLPASTSRRNHRVPVQLHAHWRSLLADVERKGGPREWLTPTSPGVDGWREMFDRALGIHGNGRYFAYKVAEVSQKVIGARITAPDAGHAHSTGPRRGLADLTTVPRGNTPAAIARLDRITEQVAAAVGDPDIAQVETSLCAWQAVAAGRCYMGLYIDEQLEELHAVTSDLSEAAWAARASSIPAAYLGEAGGWRGVQRERCGVYRNTGRILERR